VKFTKTAFPDIFLIKPDVFRDTRGFFMETYNQKKYAEGGIDQGFVQDNYSHSGMASFEDFTINSKMLRGNWYL